jgi:hypothetical protein
MARTLIPLKFKQIAVDNFPNIPDDAPIVQLIAIAGSKTDVSVTVVKTGLDWLETHGEEMELKDGVTPGKGFVPVWQLRSPLAQAKLSNKPKSQKQRYLSQPRKRPLKTPIIEIAPTSEGEGYFDRTDCLHQRDRTKDNL